MTTSEPRGGETRAADTATTSPRYDVPVSRVHTHADDHGPFHVVVCTEGWASREYADPADAHQAQADHDLRHEDELQAAS